MLKSFGDDFWRGSGGEDIFGEPFPGQIAKVDEVNKHMTLSLL